MLCLHGLGGSALNFAVVGPALASAFRVVALDLPGHGGSRATPLPRQAGRRAPSALLDCLDVVQGLLADQERYPVLLGHSLGGILALLHATRSPGRLGGLVLLAPPVARACGRRIDPRLAARHALLSAPGVRRLVSGRVASASAHDLVRMQIEQATPDPGAVPADVVAAAIAEEAARPGRAEAARTQWDAIVGVVALLARPARFHALLRGLDVPALWLQGDEDPRAPVASARALAHSLPAWAYAERNGVGHLPHLEDPAWVVDRIEEWARPEGGPTWPR
nr:alpha/beta fold hydrolase [Motilibacter deserti]